MKIQLFQSKFKILILIALLTTLSACDDVLVRPAHNSYDDYYHYQYYPSLRVYFDTGRGLYFYYTDDRGWISSRRLPRHYNLRRHRYERLRLRDRRPYRHHRSYPNRRYRSDDRRRDRERYRY